MKIRYGFVSNSSASSFLVEVSDWMDLKKPPTEYITEAQKKLLLDYGFKPTLAHYPMFLYTHGFPMSADDKSDPDRWIWKVKPSHYKHGMVGYGYSVVCNEDEVIAFLLKHGIRFRAVTHYGHWNVIYNGGKAFWKIGNLGEQIDMYGRRNPRTEYKEIRRFGGKWEKMFQQISVKEYLRPRKLKFTKAQKKRLKKLRAKIDKMNKEETKKHTRNHVRDK